MKKKIAFWLLIIVNISPCFTYHSTGSGFVCPNDTNLIIKKIPFKLGDSTIYAVMYKSGTDEVIYFNMHDDENTAVEAAKRTIKKYGGCFIELKAQGTRLITFSADKQYYTFDPNRIFTEHGVEETLKKNGKYSDIAKEILMQFARDLIVRFFKRAYIIISVHNNSATAFSIKDYQKGGRYEKEAKRVYYSPKSPLGDFCYVIDEQYFDKIRVLHLNAVLQDNENVTDDGSLSVYCSKKSIKYINVEAQLNHLNEQIENLKAIQHVFVIPK